MGSSFASGKNSTLTAYHTTRRSVSQAGETPEVEGLPAWLVLPNIGQKIPRKFNPRESAGGKLDIRRLIQVLQSGQLSNGTLQKYFSHVDDDYLHKQINEDIEGIPAIFYVANSNDANILRTWISKGGNANAILRPSMSLLHLSVLLCQTFSSARRSWSS